MPTLEDKQKVDEIREVVRTLHPIYKQFNAAIVPLEKLAGDLRAWETKLHILLNAQDQMEGKLRDAESRLAMVENQAKTRLISIEQNTRTLTDRLIQKEAALDAKLAECDRQKTENERLRHEAEVYRNHLEQKLKGLSEVTPKDALAAAPKAKK